MIPYTNCIRKELFDLKDEVVREMEYVEQWMNRLIMQTYEESQAKRDYCEVCGAHSDLVLHHIAGEKHDDRTVTVCYKCHQWLSTQQKVWDKRWWQPDQPEIVRRMFLLMGLRDLLRLKAMKTYDWNYDTLANKLTEHISKILKEE
jgi:hypothetical protein